MVSSEYRLNRSISSPAPNTIFDFRYSFFYFFLFFSFLNLFIFYFYQSMTRVEAEALLLYYTVPYSHIRGGGMVFFGGCLRVAAIILQYKIIKKILFQTCSKEGNYIYLIYIYIYTLLLLLLLLLFTSKEGN